MTDSQPPPDQIATFLAGVGFFSGLNEGALSTLAAKAQVTDVGFGERIFEPGHRADGIMVIFAGKVRLFENSDGRERSIGVREAGDSFAEISAIRDYPLDYAARASSKSKILLIPRSDILREIDRNPSIKEYMSRYAAIRAAGGFFERFFNLGKSISREELDQTISSLGIKKFRSGERILSQGDRGDQRLYIIRQGEVRVLRTEDSTEYPLGTLRKGEFFGQRAALSREAQEASALAVTETVLIVVPVKTLRFVMENNPLVRQALEEQIEFSERELERQKRLSERKKPWHKIDLTSKKKKNARLVRRFSLVEQAEEMDCGAACLQMICRHYKIPITLGKLREMANVTQEGATLDSIARTAESLGFTARAIDCSYGVLANLELPLLAHWEGYHYVIVYGISPTEVWIADPGRGFRKLSRSEFEKGWNGTCMTFEATDAIFHSKATQSPWVRFAKYILPYRHFLRDIFIATLAIELLGLAPPIIVQNILDRVVVHGNLELLQVLIIGYVTIVVFTGISSFLRSYLSNFMVRSLDLTMMSHFMRHTFSLPLSFFTRRKTGDVIARFQENETVRDFLTQSTISTLLDSLMVFLYFGVMFLYNPRLTFILLLFVPPMVILTLVITPRLRHYARRTFETSTDSESFLVEAVSGVETIKAMGVERSVRMKWEKKYVDSLNVQFRSAQFEAKIELATSLLNAATTITILSVGASMVVSGKLTIGQLIAFNALMAQVMQPLTGVIKIWDELQETGVAMERLGDMLDLDSEQPSSEADTRVVIPSLRGDIRLNKVYFRYGGKENPYVLEDINLHIEAQSTVALVGQSGSGKTTLAKMLVGFYQPTEGSLHVDGYDIKHVDLAQFRSQVGYVMQNNLLFSGTIAENIAIGDPNPDRRRVIEVANQADAHGFITNLPLGYEQVVGERGMGISGGQAQRICIARALYHDPRLLILDEATSALDSQSESNILHNMRDILKGRTTLVIAHRLSTIMNADKILVLYEGGIAESGTHNELIANEGMYYHLVRKQLSSGMPETT